jgi:hypothetical protein
MNKEKAVNEILANYDLRDKLSGEFNLDIHLYWGLFFKTPMPMVNGHTYFGSSSWINYHEVKSMLVAAALEYKKENNL